MSQREAVVAGSTADHQGKDAWPRKRSANEMEVDEFFSEEAIRDVYNDYFFPKFLTSRELLELEVRRMGKCTYAFLHLDIDMRHVIARRCQLPSNRSCSVSRCIPISGWVPQQ